MANDYIFHRRCIIIFVEMQNVEWKLPPGYTMTPQPIPVAFPPHAAETGNRIGRLASVACEQLNDLFGIPPNLFIIVVAPPEDSNLFPEFNELKQAELIFPCYFADRTPPGILFPSVLQDPIRPATTGMLQMMIWREVVRHTLVSEGKLPMEQTPFWLIELAVWFGAICIARSVSASLTELLIGIHDGRESPKITEYSKLKQYTPVELMGLHKQLFALGIEIYARCDVSFLPRLILLLTNCDNRENGKLLLKKALGAEQSDWISKHPGF